MSAADRLKKKNDCDHDVMLLQANTDKWMAEKKWRDDQEERKKKDPSFCGSLPMLCIECKGNFLRPADREE